ncbi:MAG: sodium:calcium antiporter [Bacillota bacterium]
MLDLLMLLLSLGIILLGAEVFTNGIEWLGKKLNLSECAVGSVLAAVGTALPETMIPVIAIVFGTGESGHDIGIGAILGAPFMLATLALFISGVAVILNAKKRPEFPKMRVNTSVMRRDFAFFLIVYTIAIGASFFHSPLIRPAVAIFLVGAYGCYVYFTLKDEHVIGDDCELHPLIIARKTPNPALITILAQVALALTAIVMGANIFVDVVGRLATLFGIPVFVLALIIAPVATELPEKFNSIIWIRKGKDTLALGNITGAMVFQSSLIPALGILLTSWELTTGAILSAVLALASSGLVYLQLRIRGYLTPYILLTGGVFYAVFVVLVITGVIT